MTTPSTRFAPAERLPAQQVQALAAEFRKSLTAATLNALPWPVLILNKLRQIVFCNGAFASVADSDQESVLADRPGEALGCLHAEAGPGGCGTSEFCRYCGAAQAIVHAGRGPTIRECRIIRLDEAGAMEALDLRVTTSAYAFDDVDLVLMAAEDISREKRLESMEHVFYHDTLNSASNLDGLAQLLEEEVSESGREYVDLLRRTSRRVREEIEAHRDLRAAEAGELAPAPVMLSQDNVLERARAAFAGHELAQDRGLAVETCPQRVYFESDPVLLGRVVGNMVKNALEASAPGDVVTLGCRVLEGEIEFHVHNPAVMPEEARLQVFKRSFSTKGEGRGLGTYSMKLLAETCLGASVGFTTSPESGTTFFVRLPREAGSEFEACET
ncbi:MAG: sensor histidine kinase [Desulfovibrionaceae bacterium]